MLFPGLSAADPLLRVRVAEAVEKISARRPDLLRPYKKKLLRDIAAIEQKEVRWHVAQMLPRLELDEAERRRAFRILVGQSPALLPAARRHRCANEKDDAVNPARSG